MRSLSTRDILWIWENGADRHSIDRALLILSAGYPDQTRDRLTRLSLGQRDSHLLTLREATFGPRLECRADCPSCGERLEFTLEVPHIRPDRPTFDSPAARTVTAEGYEITAHLPDSHDLAAVAACGNGDRARALLVERCIAGVRRKGRPVPAERLPKKVVDQLIASLPELDPGSEVSLDLACSACDHSWILVFDIAGYFWTEISAIARRLLREVHWLARAYGWRESEILEMSTLRREHYLDMVL